ncbi:MAG: pilus assembly protein TadG-related protein [Planctomycetaceae bacterium]
MNRASFISQLRRARGGKILVLFAVALPMLFGMLGLVIDGGMLFAERRSTQQVADAAAAAAARTLASGGSPAEAVAAATELVKTHNGLGSANVAVHVPPILGDHAGLSGYVQVEIDTSVKTAFMQVLGSDDSSNVVTRATAGYEPATVGAAVVVLDPNPPEISLAPLTITLPIPLVLPGLLGGFEVLGLGTVQVDGAVLVNNTWGGVDEDGNPIGESQLLEHAVRCMPLLPLTRLRATDIRVVGGVDDPDYYASTIPGESSPLQAGRLPVPDPYADLPAPTVGVDPANVRNQYYGGVTVINIPILFPPVVLEPGVYDWIQVVTGPVTFRPGVYIIRGAHPLTGIALNLLAGPVVADGVMFYITDTAAYSAVGGGPDSSDGETAPPAPEVLTLLPSVLINAAVLGNRLSGLNDPGSPFHGLLIYQRRTLRKPMVIASEQLLGGLLGQNSFSGTVYSKWGHVILALNGTYDARFVVGTLRCVNVLACRLAPTDLLPPAMDVFLVE